MELTNLNRERNKTRRKAAADMGPMVYGKVPPQAKELEEAQLIRDMQNDIAAQLLRRLASLTL